ncbi:MAG: hypothetical protein AB8B82_15890 [Roseovarius sp.]
MNSIRFPLRVVIAAFVITFLAAIAAHAIDEACPDHPSCVSPIVVGGSCQIYLEGFGSQVVTGNRTNRDLYWRNRSWTPGCYREDDIYALQGFRFNTRGGHKIKNFAVLNRSRDVSFALEDADSGDLASGFIWVTLMPRGSERRFVTATCRGECIVDLPRDRLDQQVVLAGFRFRRVDGDGHVRRVMVMPMAPDSMTDGRYRVAFQDDDFEYDVLLQYALIPADTLSNTQDVRKLYNRGGSYTDEERADPDFVHHDLRIRDNPGWNILRGFEFEFRNGGHFIEDIGIEKNQHGFEAWFQDNQADNERRYPDDPFEWRIIFSGYQLR